MKRNTKYILLPCVLILCMVLCSCGGAVTTDGTVQTEQKPSETEMRAPADAEPATGEPTEEPTEAPTEPPAEEPTEDPSEPQPTAPEAGGEEEPDPLPEVPTGTSPTDWNMILVNPWNKMPEDYTVELTELGYGHYIDVRAYNAWEEMFDAAYAAGVQPVVCSSYRTNEKQTSLYWNKVSEYRGYGYEESEAQRLAGMWVAYPGTSEHQLGLALDIVDKNYSGLDWEQENTDAQKWLMENSYKYGFILRYPSDKAEITGINYEPWHYRYVGKEAAAEIYELGVCLEEYLEMKKA